MHGVGKILIHFEQGKQDAPTLTLSLDDRNNYCGLCAAVQPELHSILLQAFDHQQFQGRVGLVVGAVILGYSYLGGGQRGPLHQKGICSLMGG